MHRSIKAFVHKGDKYYVAECLEIAVVTQGKTLDETIANLQEAVSINRFSPWSAIPVRLAAAGVKTPEGLPAVGSPGT